MRAAAACLLVAAGVACGDSGPTGPHGPGAFHAELVSPNGSEGAAVFELAGTFAVLSVTSENGEIFYHQAGATLRVIVLNNNAGTIRFQVQVDEIRDLPTATVVQVADGDDELRESLAGYDVQLLQVEEGGAP